MIPSQTRRRANKAALAIVAASVGCGPTVAVTGGDSDDDGTSGHGTDEGPVATTTTHTTDPSLPSTTMPSADDSGGSLDEGPATSDGDDTGPGPDIPPLPDACAGDVLAGDALKPNEVYLAGTLSEGACWLDALSHWTTPDDAVAGFDCYFDGATAKIRPADGRLVYTNTFEGVLREFHCDTCPITDVQTYPDTVLNNDTVLPTPMCGRDDFQNIGFLLAADTGYAYRCAFNSSIWYDDAGDVVHDDTLGLLLHLGFGGLALTEAGVLDRSTGEIAPFDGLPMGLPVAVRAVEDGFNVVMVLEQPELWHVLATGEATSLGVYPPVPAGYTAYSTAALDGCGMLYQLGEGPITFEDVILRRDIAAETNVVYTETVDPLVKIHISYLVTGP